MIKSNSLANLAPALVKAQKSMGAALKDAKNPFFRSKYADLNAIIDAAVPALNEQGIAVLQSPAVVQTGYDGNQAPVYSSVINTILLHESGEYIAGQSKVVPGKQNDAQSEGSATTYARRYGLQAMVTLKAEDDDGNAASGKVATPVQKTEPAKAPVEAPKTGRDNSPTFDQLIEAAQDAKKENTPVKKVSGWGSKKTAVKPAGTDY